MKIDVDSFIKDYSNSTKGINAIDVYVYQLSIDK